MPYTPENGPGKPYTEYDENNLNQPLLTARVLGDLPNKQSLPESELEPDDETQTSAINPRTHRFYQSAMGDNTAKQELASIQKQFQLEDTVEDPFEEEQPNQNIRINRIGGQTSQIDYNEQLTVHTGERKGSLKRKALGLLIFAGLTASAFLGVRAISHDDNNSHTSATKYTGAYTTQSTGATTSEPSAAITVQIIGVDSPTPQAPRTPGPKKSRTEMANCTEIKKGDWYGSVLQKLDPNSTQDSNQRLIYVYIDKTYVGNGPGGDAQAFFAADGRVACVDSTTK